MESFAPKLSIIVPVKDDERIFGLLARLSESSELTSCEVIVACNGSLKEFSDRISSAVGVIPLARALTDHVANPARAINAAARVATGEKLLILDSACVPCSGYLQSLLTSLSARSDYRHTGKVSGRNGPACTWARAGGCSDIVPGAGCCRPPSTGAADQRLESRGMASRIHGCVGHFCHTRAD